MPAGAANARTGLDNPAPPEKMVRPHLVFRDARGAKVANALVNARTRRRKLRPHRTTKDGDVLLDEVAPSEAPLVVTVRDARYGKQSFAAEVEERQQRFVLATPRRGLVTGTIATSDGTPVQGAVLTLVDADGITSEPDIFWSGGRYSVEVVPGAYKVRAGAKGYCPSDWTQAGVSLDRPAEVDLVVLRATTIAGVVGLPAGVHAPLTVDLELEAQTKEGPVAQTNKVRLGSLGDYRLDAIRPGWYRLRACDAAHDGSWGTTQALEGVPVEGFTLFLDRDRSDKAVEGRVHDPAGEPVAAATVWAHGHRTVTDDKGSFVLRLDDHDTQVVLSIEQDGFVPVEKTVSFDPGETRARGLEVTLEPLD